MQCGLHWPLISYCALLQQVAWELLLLLQQAAWELLLLLQQAALSSLMTKLVMQTTDVYLFIHEYLLQHLTK